MEVINYAASGQNMSLPDDAQFIQGVSGSACYLINGEGKVQLTGGNMAIFTLSIWRRWDGIVEADKPRPFFKFKNFKVFFNGNTDILNIAIQNDTVLQTAVKDDKNFNHWVFVFARNKFLTVYKNTKEVFKTPTDDAPVDLSEPFILGGDFTHATFDEFSIFDNELSKDHIDGLYQFISRGTNLSNVEGLINESVPQHTPHYLGTVKTAPDGARVNIFLGRKNGFNDANIGDWILIIEPIAGYKRGWCYRWQGASWEILDPPERYIQEYTACIKDQLELKDMFNDTKFFGAVLCQYLGFNEAVGKSLTANKIFVDNFVTKKLLVDHDLNDPTDFELAINRDVGMLAKNNGERIFEVTPTGNIFAKNAFLQDGTFTGDIYSGPLELSSKEPKSETIEIKTSESMEDVYKKLNDNTYGLFITERTFNCASVKGIPDVIKFLIRCQLTSKSGYGGYMLAQYTLILFFKNGHNKSYIKGGVSHPYRDDRLEQDTTFQAHLGAKTFKIKGIPTLKSKEKDVVWVDANGFLRLS